MIVVLAFPGHVPFVKTMSGKYPLSHRPANGEPAPS
jgi:hypothetical protein